MSKFKIRHITRYIYDETVRDSANQIMLYPIEDEFQDIIDHSIAISGTPPVDIYLDYYGNKVGTFTHAQPHSELLIDSSFIVITKKRNVVNDSAPAAQQWNELQQLKFDLDYIDFLKQERYASRPEVEAVIASLRQPNDTPLQLAASFSKYIFDTFTYQKGITTVETTMEEIWKLKSGVCQDFANVLLAMLRLANIPARYVSGYICPKKNGMRGEGATHAWVDAYIPGNGWVGLDPTNNCMVDETHVKLAVGKNFTDCSPVKGTYRGTSTHTLEVAVSVSYEDGDTSSEESEIISPKPAAVAAQNSYRRFQEMQMQQQQQQQ